MVYAQNVCYSIAMLCPAFFLIFLMVFFFHDQDRKVSILRMIGRGIGKNVAAQIVDLLNWT